MPGLKSISNNTFSQTDRNLESRESWGPNEWSTSRVLNFKTYIPPEYLVWDIDMAKDCVLEPQIGMNKIWTYLWHVVSVLPRKRPFIDLCQSSFFQVFYFYCSSSGTWQWVMHKDCDSCWTAVIINIKTWDRDTAADVSLMFGGYAEGTRGSDLTACWSGAPWFCLQSRNIYAYSWGRAVHTWWFTVDTYVYSERTT